MTHGPADEDERVPAADGDGPDGDRMHARHYRPSPTAGSRRHAGPVGRVRAALLLPAGRSDEAREQRVRPQRLRLELGMELHGDVPRVAGQFDDLDELAVGRAARDRAAPCSASVGSYRRLNS